eukprot:2769715-Amphidinium_carterae.2
MSGAAAAAAATGVAVVGAPGHTMKESNSYLQVLEFPLGCMSGWRTSACSEAGKEAQESADGEGASSWSDSASRRAIQDGRRADV